MIFANSEDYQGLELEDELEIENLLEQIPTRTVTIKNKTRHFLFDVKLEITDNEMEVVLNGGQLAYLKKQLTKEA